MENSYPVTEVETGKQRSSLLEAELIGCMPIFSVLRAQLGETAKEVERAVVDVCQGFQGIVQRARESVQQASGTVAGKHARTGTPPSHSQTLLDAAQKMMERSEAATQSCLHAVEKMAKLEDQMSRIEDSLADIDAIAKAVRLLGFNATIEAARAGEHGRAFGVVADETTKLAAKATQINKSIERTVQQLCKDTNDASRELRGISRKFVDDCRVSRTELNEAVGAMTAREKELKSAVEHSAHVSKLLADDVSRAVIGLQFQDRMNQQITHVVDALQGVEDGLTECLHGTSGKATAESRQKRRDRAEHLMDAYTMQSERDIHATRMNATKGGMPSLGDNVEFF